MKALKYFLVFSAVLISCNCEEPTSFFLPRELFKTYGWKLVKVIGESCFSEVRDLCFTRATIVYTHDDDEKYEKNIRIEYFRTPREEISVLSVMPDGYSVKTLRNMLAKCVVLPPHTR